MFFRSLGSFVARFWPAVILFWILAIVGFALFVPDLGQVAREDRGKFLPAECDSVQAKALLDQYFPEDSSQCRAVLAIEKETPVTDGDLQWLDTRAQYFAQDPAFQNVKKVLTPINSKLLRDKLVSKDGKAAMAVIYLTTPFVAKESQEFAGKVLDHLSSAPAGIHFEATGDAILGRDYQQAIRDSLHRTTWATVLLLCVILILIFRSPVTPWIPLVTIGISFFVSKGIASLMAMAGVAVSPLTEILLVVVLFGAGTDYCVFLIFRYCEEVFHGGTPHEAVKTALKTVGEAISSSALTVIIGVGCLLFAEFGPFKQTGPFIAIGVAVTLVAALTLTPALILAFRPILFWPIHKPRYNLHPKITQPVSKLVTRKPFLVTCVLLLALAPFFYFGMKAERSFDLLRELPESFPSHRGLAILKRHFSLGEMAPLQLVFRAKTKLNTPQGLELLHRLTRDLSSRAGVLEVRSAVAPIGDIHILDAGLLKNQLEKVNDGLTQLTAGSQKTQNGLDQILKKMEDSGLASEKKDFVADLFTGGKKSQAAQLHAALLQLSNGNQQILSGLGRVSQTTRGWADPHSGAKQPLDNLALPADILEREPRLKDAFDYYISPDGYVARLTLVLKDIPYSNEEKDTILSLKTFLKEEIPRLFFTGKGYFSGSGSVILDERIVTKSDFNRVLLCVLGGIFLILIFLLGKWWIPLYLIPSMIFTYYVSLGVTRLLFETGLRVEGLDWKVPFFMFVLLVALGEDYNIFLMSRIKEERRKQDMTAAVHTTLLRTGPLIGFCGVILAGTFFTLMLSPLEAFVQLGFGIAAGVLLATYIVVPMLVPSLALLADRITSRKK